MKLTILLAIATAVLYQAGARPVAELVYLVAMSTALTQGGRAIPVAVRGRAAAGGRS